MPVFSSGQWAGTVPATWTRVRDRRPAVHVRRRHPRASGRSRRRRDEHSPGVGRDARRTSARGIRRARRRSWRARWRSSAEAMTAMAPRASGIVLLRRRLHRRHRYARHGWPCAGLRAPCCSCGLPSAAHLERAGPLDCLGIAGAARSMDAGGDAAPNSSRWATSSPG